MSAYDEGYDAYYRNQSIYDNPFYAELWEWADWRNGWFDAECDFMYGEEY